MIRTKPTNQPTNHIWPKLLIAPTFGFWLDFWPFNNCSRFLADFNNYFFFVLVCLFSVLFWWNKPLWYNKMVWFLFHSSLPCLICCCWQNIFFLNQLWNVLHIMMIIIASNNKYISRGNIRNYLIRAYDPKWFNNNNNNTLKKELFDISVLIRF